MILTPRITEVNRGNHISNLAIIAWFEDAREDITQLLSHSIDGIEFYTVIVHIDCKFKNEVFYNSDVEIATKVIAIGNSSFTIKQTVFQNKILAAESSTVLVYFNRHTKSAASIPDNVKNQLLTYT